MAADSIALVDHLFRRQAGQMVARLTRALGSRHLAVAEDAVQDALIAALQQWPFRGVPDQPEAWLFSAFHLEAGIAACHAVAPSWDATDWPQIISHYDDLLALTGSPVVAMNRAIAALARYPLLPAVEAELWREAGDHARAVASYREALTLARSAPEQRWLSSRLTHLV